MARAEGTNSCNSPIRFASSAVCKRGHPSQVATRPAEAGDESERDGITTSRDIGGSFSLAACGLTRNAGAFQCLRISQIRLRGSIHSDRAHACVQ
jgi:hypothetical protein